MSKEKRKKEKVVLEISGFEFELIIKYSKFVQKRVLLEMKS